MASPSQPQLYLDEFATGQIYPSGPIAVAAQDIKSFAAQFDPQPFHLDEAAAAGTFFGGLAASGWHTTAITMRLLVDGLPIAGGIIGAGVDELRWMKPVRPGDRLRQETLVLEVRPSRSRPDQGMMKVRTTTFNQNDEPVQMMTSNLVVPRRS